MNTVLIVDDNPSDRALFRVLLTRDGYAVHDVSRGDDAIVRALEVRPHVIILDVILPDSDGYSVCRAIKAEPRLSGVPILMLTVRDDERDIIAGLEAGADDYVVKDAPKEIILARVRRLVHYRQMATASVLNEQLAQVGRLLAGIVHEIRGPLSVIRGNAELMKFTLKPEDQCLQWVDPIIRGCQLLQVRLEHLMAAVRGGAAVLQAIDVHPVVREATDLFQKGTDPRAGKVEIVIEPTDGKAPILGDAGRLMQVLLNLLGNAHEAIVEEHKDGRIAVRVGREPSDGVDWVVVQVTDSGPGIPETHLSRVFEPFFTTKSTGSGYGLYLASEILREHRGRLTAHNPESGGACFTLWLPPAPAPGA